MILIISFFIFKVRRIEDKNGLFLLPDNEGLAEVAG